MPVLGKTLSTMLMEGESSHYVKYLHCYSVFTGIIEALGNRYSLVCVKPRLQPKFLQILHSCSSCRWKCSSSLKGQILGVCFSSFFKEQLFLLLQSLSPCLAHSPTCSSVRQKTWGKGTIPSLMLLFGYVASKRTETSVQLFKA